MLLKPGKLYWNLSEQGWAKAAWSFFGTWNCGASLFILDDRGAFSPIRLLDIIHKYPITTLCAPPTAYRQLVLEESQRHFESNPPNSLEHCTGAGEPLNESVIKTWQKMSGMQIFDGYGQTETILICGNQKGNPIKPGSMGKPLPNVPLAVIDGDRKETKTGTEGDIAVLLDDLEGEKGDSFFGIFDGYIDMKTGKLDRRLRSFKGEPDKAWYLTGDRATRDEDGYFWFVGRSDDVINSSGYRIGELFCKALNSNCAHSDLPSRPIRSREHAEDASGGSRERRSGISGPAKGGSCQSIHRVDGEGEQDERQRRSQEGAARFLQRECRALQISTQDRLCRCFVPAENHQWEDKAGRAKEDGER